MAQQYHCGRRLFLFSFSTMSIWLLYTEMEAEGPWTKRFTPAKTVKKKTRFQWIYPYIKPELVINPSLDPTLAKVNESYCDWFGMNCELAKGPDVLRLLLEQLRCGEREWVFWDGGFGHKVTASVVNYPCS